MGLAAAEETAVTAPTWPPQWPECWSRVGLDVPPRVTVPEREREPEPDLETGWMEGETSADPGMGPGGSVG